MLAQSLTAGFTEFAHGNLNIIRGGSVQTSATSLLFMDAVSASPRSSPDCPGAGSGDCIQGRKVSHADGDFEVNDFLQNNAVSSACSD